MFEFMLVYLIICFLCLTLFSKSPACFRILTSSVDTIPQCRMLLLCLFHTSVSTVLRMSEWFELIFLLTSIRSMLFSSNWFWLCKYAILFWSLKPYEMIHDSGCSFIRLYWSRSCSIYSFEPSFCLIYLIMIYKSWKFDGFFKSEVLFIGSCLNSHFTTSNIVSTLLDF